MPTPAHQFLRDQFQCIVLALPSRSGQRQLVAAAMRYTGLTTKRAVIEEALRTLVRLKAQESVRSLGGQLHWEGDLDTMRRSRFECELNLTVDNDFQLQRK